MNKTEKKFWRIVAILGITVIIIILGKYIYEQKQISELIHNAIAENTHQKFS